MLENLLGNAWKYTAKTERATTELFRSETRPGEVEFCVRDNGAGFDMRFANMLFRPFKRLHGAHEFEGTGIGLATVRRVIERHGGAVRADGSVGKRAMFWFSLPDGAGHGRAARPCGPLSSGPIHPDRSEGDTLDMARLASNRLAAVALVVLLGGCATPSTEVVVPVEVDKVAPREAGLARRAQVQLTDLRKEAHLERTTIGGISMGRILLRPPAQEIVRKLVETKADASLAQRGITAPQTVLAGIRIFDIETPATPVYWDVNARIELVLRVRGQDRTVAGAATERTFVWPSEEMIARVTAEALRQVSAGAERALDELFAAAR